MKRVFVGTLEECREFVRTNRFSVLLSHMEIVAAEGVKWQVRAFVNERSDDGK